MASFNARPAGNGITRRTMIKTSAVLIGSCALGFTGVTSLGCSADNNGGGAFPGPEPCRRHHSALLSRWRKPRSLPLDVGAAWVPCHRDGNAAHAQRRRRELRRRRFHPI